MDAVIYPEAVRMSTDKSEADGSINQQEVKTTKRKISLSSCAVCGTDESRYTCPRCLTHSCSLHCVKKHKEDSGCSGVRDKTAFVALSHFDEIALLSDYRFLEDTGRFSDGANRDSLIKIPHVTLKGKRFLSKARKMNINLRLLPCTFSKSKENSTFFFSKEQRFMWHLKLIFPQSGAEFTQRRVSDQLTLRDILIPYIHPTDSDPVSRQKLKAYALESFEHVKVFMKAEGRKANSERYHELDLQKTLRDNLSFKTLIEYPVLHVVLKGHWEHYPLKSPELSSNVSTFSTERGNRHQENEPTVFPKTSTVCAGLSETDFPQAKRAKREVAEEDKEEGELSNDSDEDGDGSSEVKLGESVTPGLEMSPMTVSKDVQADKENADGDGTGSEQGDGSKA